MIKDDYFNEKRKRWDTYFHTICVAVSSKSPCLSRQIGAILVRNNSVVSTGYNGPPRSFPHCKPAPMYIVDESYEVDPSKLEPGSIIKVNSNKPIEYKAVCPRKAKGYRSGEGLLECPATHAEANCIANAARIGACTVGTTLYMNCIIPCKDCMSILINAGIREIVVDDIIPYHELSLDMAQAANIKLRRFLL